MYRRMLLPIYIALIFGLGGCSTPTPTLPDVRFPLDNFNTDLRILFPARGNDYRIGTGVAFDVELTTSKEVFAPIDFNAMIFVYNTENGNWEEINNTAGYLGQDQSLSKDKPIAYAGVFPDIGDGVKKPVKLMVVIYGYEKVNGVITENKVGAYREFMMYP